MPTRWRTRRGANVMSTRQMASVLPRLVMSGVNFRLSDRAALQNRRFRHWYARDRHVLDGCSSLNKQVFFRPGCYFGTGLAVACPNQVEQQS